MVYWASCLPAVGRILRIFLPAVIGTIAAALATSYLDRGRRRGREEGKEEGEGGAGGGKRGEKRGDYAVTMVLIPGYREAVCGREVLALFLGPRLAPTHHVLVSVGWWEGRSPT